MLAGPGYAWVCAGMRSRVSGLGGCFQVVAALRLTITRREKTKPKKKSGQNKTH